MRESDEIHVFIKYRLLPSKGYLLIEERNKPLVPAGPIAKPEYEYVQIEGKEVIKTEGDFGLGRGVKYSFNLNEIYFIVEIDGIASTDAVKIVESIIVQGK